MKTLIPFSNVSVRRSGFTLIELSIVLLVISLMIAGITSVITQDIRRTKKMDVQSKMDAIEKALYGFVEANGRLPCPSIMSTQYTDPAFGAEDTHGSYVGISCVNVTRLYGIRSGAVPVKTLGLPDEAMFDPWGGRIRYTVDSFMTVDHAFSINGINSTSGSYPDGPPPGDITVLDGSTYPASHARTNSAIAVLLSYGPNGYGAHQLSGTVKNSVFGASTNVDEQINYEDGYPGATFVQHSATTSPTDPLNVFDDIVRYYSRASFASPTFDRPNVFYFNPDVPPR